MRKGVEGRAVGVAAHPNGRDRLPLRASAVLLAALLSTTACSTLNSVKNTFFGGPPSGAEPERLSGYVGGAVADEPRAALAAREVLILGGSAVDAAVALGFTLSVTLPSRAGLGGGGACLVLDPSRNGLTNGGAEAVMFLPRPTAGGAGADRPAAVPMLARGLFAMHARFGRRPFETLVAPAEQLARFGVQASRALVRDLAPVAGPLAADPAARAVFAPNGAALTEGAQLVQPDLSATLAQLRTVGVGDLYQGSLARRLEEASRSAGGPITLPELRAALPSNEAPMVLTAGRDQVAFLPPPADGGLAAAAAFQALRANPTDLAGAQRAGIGAAARWRQGGATPQAILASPQTGSLPPLGASTTFSVLDRAGVSVTCALTMDNLFGTGRIAPGTGVLLASSPAAVTPPLLSAAVAWSPNLRSFRAAVGGSGQEGAPVAAAFALANTLAAGQPLPQPPPDPGRANVIACARYADSEGSCAWATDPRGAGLAAGSN